MVFVNRRESKNDGSKEFLVEAEDILAEIGKGFVKLGKGVKAGVIDPAVLNAIFRSAHTLKGMAGVYEFKELAGLIHSLEDVLDSLRLGKARLDDEAFSALMGAYEIITKILPAKGMGISINRDEIAVAAARLAAVPQTNRDSDVRVARELKALLTEYEEHRLSENIREGRNIFIVNCSFPVNSFDSEYIALLELLKQADNTELIATLPSSLTTIDYLCFDLLIGTQGDMKFMEARINGRHGAVIRALNDSGPASKPRGAYPKSISHDAPMPTLRRSTNTVRVNISKLDKLMTIIGELGLLKSNLSSMNAVFNSMSASAVFCAELGRIENIFENKLKELRANVMDIRMVPISLLFSRFEAFLEKLGRDVGKDVKMVVIGGETVVDKVIIEELADPLMHIIRNAVDHALEPPAARKDIGKPACGVITLRASHKGNYVVVEVEDDGCGIDDALVRDKAASRGIAPREYLNAMPRQEAIELIFTPGFSTRDIASETSGRGIGMDVVRENIKRLSGIIDVDTVKGRGTRIILTIPVTLTISQALMVESSGARYAVPLSAIIDVIELRSAQCDNAARDGFIKISDREVPCIRLCDLVGSPAVDVENGYGVVTGMAEHRLCLIVDRIMYEMDVIVKPLPEAARLQGIAGETDVDDKGAALVIDLAGILEELAMRKLSKAKI